MCVCPGYSTSYSYEKLAIRIPHQNSCTFKLKNYAFVETCCNICKYKTMRAILIVMELNISGIIGQIIWLANQNRFLLF